MSVFIVATDDPEELRRFAHGTAQEIRERVAEPRNKGGEGTSARGRRPGSRRVSRQVVGGSRRRAPGRASLAGAGARG
ncbi:hypothetical protein AB0K18_37595 [Nonomuraea sp. NPDC049421]|uniref:hypothetical protein n=1 Tax=Nonomuraea sp. NPDC049421 TaxID=3155275 RepID=UPI00343DFA00